MPNETLLERLESHKFSCHDRHRYMAGVNVGLSESQKKEYEKLKHKSDSDPLTSNQRSKLGLLKSKVDAGEATPNQTAELALLQAKANKNPLTPNQQVKYADLKKLADRELFLSKGAETALKETFQEIFFGRTSHIVTNSIEKGIMCEDQSLTLFQEVTGQFVGAKNEVTFEDDLSRGTPDHILSYEEEILEIKSSFRRATFPFFKDKAPSTYWWQCQAYLALTGLEVANLAYCLVDSPFHIIDDELRRTGWKLNTTTTDSLPKEVVVEVVQDHIYSKKALEEYCLHNINVELSWFDNFFEIPKEDRVKLYKIKVDDNKLKDMYTILGMAKDRLLELYIEFAEARA